MAVTITCSACRSRFRVQPKSVEQSVPCPACDHLMVVAAVTNNPSTTGASRRGQARPGGAKKGAGESPSAPAAPSDQYAAPGLAFIEAMLFYCMFFFGIVILVGVFYWMLCLELMNLSPTYAEGTAGPYFDSEGLPYWNVVSRTGMFARGVWWTCRVVGTLVGIGALFSVLTNGIALARGQTELPPQTMPYAFGICQTLGIGAKTRQSRTNLLLFSLFLALPVPLLWLVMPSAETGVRWALTRDGFKSPVETVLWKDIQQIDLRHFADLEKSAPGHVKSGFKTINILHIEMDTTTGKKEIVSPYGMGTRYRARAGGDPGTLSVLTASAAMISLHTKARQIPRKRWKIPIDVRLATKDKFGKGKQLSRIEN